MPNWNNVDYFDILERRDSRERAIKVKIERIDVQC